MLLTETSIMSIIGEIVSNYAFPIVMCYLLFQQNQSMTRVFEELVQALIAQSEARADSGKGE